MSEPKIPTFGDVRMSINGRDVPPLGPEAIAFDHDVPAVGTVQVTVHEGLVLVRTSDRVRKNQQACAIMSTGEVGGWRRRDMGNPDRPAISAWWAETARPGEIAMLSMGRKARRSELP